MVYFESMSNPLLVVADVAEITRRVHEINPEIVVAVDNTFFSPYNFRPLDVGVDIDAVFFRTDPLLYQKFRNVVIFR